MKALRSTIATTIVAGIVAVTVAGPAAADYGKAGYSDCPSGDNLYTRSYGSGTHRHAQYAGGNWFKWDTYTSTVTSVYKYKTWTFNFADWTVGVYSTSDASKLGALCLD